MSVPTKTPDLRTNVSTALRYLRAARNWEITERRNTGRGRGERGGRLSMPRSNVTAATFYLKIWTNSPVTILRHMAGWVIPVTSVVNMSRNPPWGIMWWWSTILIKLGNVSKTWENIEWNSFMFYFNMETGNSYFPFFLRIFLRKYPCQTCGKIYKTKTDLDTHSTKHSGKPGPPESLESL